jgi:hypothetical protein
VETIASNSRCTFCDGLGGYCMVCGCAACDGGCGDDSWRELCSRCNGTGVVSSRYIAGDGKGEAK